MPCDVFLDLLSKQRWRTDQSKKESDVSLQCPAVFGHNSHVQQPQGFPRIRLYLLHHHRTFIVRSHRSLQYVFEKSLHDHAHMLAPGFFERHD